VLELGAGWCDFSNHVKAARVVAMDLDSTVQRAADGRVQAVVGDCTDLAQFGSAEFDVVFASNLLEHLERDMAEKLLSEAARVLSPGGRLILMQPNFRLNPGGYFDDFTHVAIYTDRSLSDYLTSLGWKVERVMPRFLPLTLRSKASHLTFLVPFYLRSPIKPLAGQMLLIATPTEAADVAR
jgi:ubiquinone/menaquinone biosynthesis C-methylase UbiE